MSRYYEMDVKVENYNLDHEAAIKAAMREEWNFEDDFEDHDTLDPEKAVLMLSGRSSLCGGESEEDFATRLSREIWMANKGPCLVEVLATYLEDLPNTMHIRDIVEYEQLLKDDPGCMDPDDEEVA
jgi:hypothetical protein